MEISIEGKVIKEEENNKGRRRRRKKEKFYQGQKLGFFTAHQVMVALKAKLQDL